MEEDKAAKLGYAGVTNEDHDEIYAIQVSKEEGLNASWIRVTRSRYVSHGGLSASGTLDDIKMAISDYEGVPPEAICKATGYDSKNGVRFDCFDFQFPTSQFELALDFTKRRGRSVRLAEDVSSENSMNNRRMDSTLKRMGRLTKRKLLSIDYGSMIIDSQWILERGDLSFDPEVAQKKYAQKKANVMQRGVRGNSGIRRSKIDHDIVWAMYQMCMTEVRRSELFSTYEGYYTCRAPLLEESPSSREGLTVAIWKLAKIIMLLFKKPRYRFGSYRFPTPRSWWDCLNVLKAKNMKDACMRNEFEKFIQKEIRVMIRLKKVKAPPAPAPEKKPGG